jgi:hypothetical protein
MNEKEKTNLEVVRKYSEDSISELNAFSYEARGYLIVKDA